MPLCFMIMPYGRKATQAEVGRGPAEIDFNGTPLKGLTDYGAFDITPRLSRGYAYKIGSPEGDDDAPYRELEPGRRIGVGTE